MPARDDILAPLLAPIAGDNPSGRWVRDDPVYEQIKDARREDDDADQGAWQRARKLADHAMVVKLTGEVLCTTSKDLQLASWWTESMLKREGVAGLLDGVVLMRRLLEDFWDTVFPELEDDDPTLRAGPLDFVGMKLVETLRAAPCTLGNHGFRQYETALLLGTEQEVSNEDSRRAARDAHAEKGEPVIEQILASVDATPKVWYVDLARTITDTTAEVYALDALGNERFIDEAPSFRRLLDALESVQRTADALLARRRLQEPDDDGSSTADVGADATAASGGGVVATLGAIPTSEADAAARVVVAARYLRRARPTDPVPYALLRALRWGALTPADGGDAPSPTLLHAPPTAERARLKGLLLEERHEELLDGVEELLGATGGGAWLDAQRWALEAAQALGDEFAPVVQVMRTALRQLLTTFPGLPQAMLLDETPVANAETQAWLHRAGLLRGSTARQGDPSATLEGMPVTPHRPMLVRARAEMAGGRLDRGVALLMADVVRERNERARFLRRLELVTVLVDAGRADIAMPIVEQLLEQLEQHKLASWEDGGVVAQALVLACRAIDATDGDSSRRRELYLRICLLDPIAALSLAAS